MITRERVDSSQRWNALIESHGGHPLQIWGWGQLKQAYGWKAERYVFSRSVAGEKQSIGAVQILYRRLPWPLRSLAYVPRGPVVFESDATTEVYAATRAAAKESVFKPIAITVEPHLEVPTGVDQDRAQEMSSEELGIEAGWRLAPEQILIPSTMIIDLRHSEDEIMANFRKKTRYSVRKSLRADIELGVCEDGCIVDELLTIYQETAKRAGFALHSDDYYRTLAREMGPNAPIIYARHEGKLIGFSWLALSRGVAFELYGGSDDVARRLDTNYALKWHALQVSQQRNVAQYDVNGLLNDAISTFKRGFSRHDNLLIGTWDYPLSNLYPVWAKLLPAARSLRRKLLSRRK